MTLALAATMVVMYARGRSSGDRFAAHLAAVIAAVGLGVGVAETLGIDCKAMIEVRNSNDAQLDAVTPHLPARFALVGWPREIDTVLALRAGRDIEYADMFESQNWANFRTLIDRWSGARRPIYALFPNDMRFNSPWPDVQFELLDPVHGLYRIEKF